MKMPSELPTWFSAIIYRLRQSWITISADDISQLELPKENREFFYNILSIIKSDASTLPRSELVDQIMRMGAKEIEEKITAIEVVIGRKQRKISTQYVTHQFNFYNNKPKSEKSVPNVKTRSPTVTALCKAFSSQSIEECQTLLCDFNRANINDLDDVTDDTPLICAVRSAITLKDVPSYQ